MATGPLLPLPCRTGGRPGRLRIWRTRTGLFSEDMRRAACTCLTTTDEPQPCRGSSTGNRGELGGEQTDDLMGLPPSLPGTSVNGVRATLPASLRDVGRRMMTSFPAPHRFKNGRCLSAHLVLCYNSSWKDTSSSYHRGVPGSLVGKRHPFCCCQSRALLRTFRSPLQRYLERVRAHSFFAEKDLLASSIRREWTPP